MKWIVWIIIIVILILAYGLARYAMSTALTTENPVGFETIQIPDANGKPIPAGVWYPTQVQTKPTTMLSIVLMDVARNAPISGYALPLVIVSHGNGGGPASHADLALALANEGYVVVAPMHSGDNYADQSAVGSVDWLPQRNREIHATIDYMLESWHYHDRIDSERIGAYGFSAGGFTVLAAVGGQPDLRIISKHCAESPEIVCELLQSVNSPYLNSDLPTVEATFLPDLRIKAAVVAAPGLGFTFVPNGLDNVHVPIQLWGAEDDINVPYATNTRLVQEALGSWVEFHSVPGASHLSFLSPCSFITPSAICSDEGQFDRKVFHADMNASIIMFFEGKMKQP